MSDKEKKPLADEPKKATATGGGSRPARKAAGGTGKSGRNGGSRGGAQGAAHSAASGERRYAKPAGGGAARGAANGERKSRKPAGSSATSGERRYAKPAGSSAARGVASGERRYAKPAGSGAAQGAASGERRYAKPAGSGAAQGATSGERRYAKPAGSSAARGVASGERRYAKPAGSGVARGVASGERRYAKPAGSGAAQGAASGERGYAKPAGSGAAQGAASGERRYAKPAGSSAARGAVSGERRYAKPAGSGAAQGAASGERRYAKPAGSGAAHSAIRGAIGSAPRYIKHADDGAPHGATPSASSGEHRYARPAGTSASSGERRYAKPAGSGFPGRAHFSRGPAGVSSPRFAAPAPVLPDARRLAFEVLCDVHQNGAFAGLSLNEHLKGAKLKPEDRRLATTLVYGTLENELRIDFALDRFMEHPTREASQRELLRMSAYQILFLDRVPDSAAVNEAVKLVKALNMESASGFINAVLRNLVRGKDELPWPQREEDLRQYLSVMGSAPLWLVDRLVAAYGPEEAESVLTHRETAHPVTVRPNLMRLTDEQFEALLQKKEQPFTRGVAPHAYLLSGVVEPGLDPDYLAGLYSIQGQSSMLAAEAVQAKPGMKVLDACAAPGGKSAYLCEAMQMTGRVYAWELHEKRALLLEAAKRRLKLENLRISVRDASSLREDWIGTLDAVLLDAPCSGTGVLAQKPDIKLRLQESDLPPIVENQRRLLNALCRYVKPGGTLVYSTCSILPEENGEQLRQFLAEHPEYALEPLPLSFPEALRKRQTSLGLQLLGYRDGVEGFFIARLRRVR